MQDFLGREYGPGDLVIYGAMSGRSINMIIGRVVEIYEVFQSRNTYKWLRLEPGQLPPFKTKYGWFVDGVLIEGRPAPGTENCEWREVATDEREETHTRVKVQPLRGARWTQHHDKTYYVDTRTGKRIDPKRSAKHVAVPSHYEYADGTHFDYEAKREGYESRSRYSQHGYMGHRNSYPWYFRDNYHINYGPVGEIRLYDGKDYRSDVEKSKEQLWYVSDTYKDYVEERKEGPKPVTLEITDNIVKWEGELPPEED